MPAWECCTSRGRARTERRTGPPRCPAGVAAFLRQPSRPDPELPAGQRLPRLRLFRWVRQPCVRGAPEVLRRGNFPAAPARRPQPVAPAANAKSLCGSRPGTASFKATAAFPPNP